MLGDSEPNLFNKEFFSLYNNPNSDFRRPHNAFAQIANRYYNPEAHQRFVSEFMNPNTKTPSLHLYHSTGSGKTLGSLGIALQFTTAYKQIYDKNRADRRNWRQEIEQSPTVFILGFGATQKQFKKEIMRFSEFGIISQPELVEMQHLDDIARSGSPADIQKYNEFRGRIKRRITDKNKGGFYQFLGYEELVNRLFFSDNLTIQELEIHAEKENINLEKVIDEKIKAGDVQINYEFLDLFVDSLVICDEVHVTYNNARKNGRGVALQYIINIITQKATSTNFRLLTLSATPFKSLASECIDWINYHLAMRRIPIIEKKDFFRDDRTMYPEKLREFGELTRGFVSYYQDIDPREYPERIFVGEPLKLPTPIAGYSRELPYLKFVECPMTQLHQDTFDNYMRENDTTKIASGARALLDTVFPNPEGEFGSFNSREITSNVMSASSEWKLKNGVEVKKFQFGASVLTGTWLHNISKWSTKYGKLLDILRNILENNREKSRATKVMVYHNKVRTSGVLFIAEILIQNGFIDEYSNPTDHTLCWLCGRYLVDHNVKAENKETKKETKETKEPKKETKETKESNKETKETKESKKETKETKESKESEQHVFIPARFVIAHSSIEKRKMEQSIDKFNHPSNKNGEQYGILLGSKIISESLDFKDIQHMIILSAPVNISSLIQIFGRAIRKNASVALPPDQRKTYIRILVTTSREGASNPISNEVAIFANKLADYQAIQEVEQEVIKNSIDLGINWNTIMTNVEREPNIGALWINQPNFPPKNADGTINYSEIKLNNFNNNGICDREVQLIIYIIKRLFIHQPVWKYDNLFTAVRDPPISLTTNPALFSEGNFAIALSFLLKNIPSHEPHKKINKFVESLYNPAIRVLYKDNIAHRIKQIGSFYILFPINIVINQSAIDTKFSQQSYNITDDLETYMVPPQPREPIQVNVSDFLSSNENIEEYSDLYTKLVDRMADCADTPTFFLYDYSESFQRWVVEKSIVEIVDQQTGSKSTKQRASQRIIELGVSLDFIVMSDEIITYSALLSRFAKKPHKGIPIGYCIRQTVKLYDNNKWFEIDKIDVNRHLQLKENNVVSFLQDEKGTIKFKIIELNSKQNSDKRKEARGMVCEYRDKDEVLTIASNLGISLRKYDEGKLNIKNVCAMIRDFMINKEIKERTRKSRYTWLYGWWSTSTKR